MTIYATLAASLVDTDGYGYPLEYIWEWEETHFDFGHVVLCEGEKARG